MTTRETFNLVSMVILLLLSIPITAIGYPLIGLGIGFIGICRGAMFLMEGGF
jgi:hypothetical protein